MNELQIFQSEEFGTIRTVTIDNEPWFVGKDVAVALGYGEGKSPINAIANHVDAEDKGVTKMMTPGGEQAVTIINESGLYSLVLGSKLESARRFKRWVTSEVLPAIRKTGGYVNDTETFVDAYFAGIPEEMKAIIRVSLDTIKIKDGIIEAQKQTIAEKDRVIEYKEDVICGLVDDIDLATKRQRIKRIIQYHVGSKSELMHKWNLLYNEFEAKYHVNLSVRFENNKDAFNQKLRNKVDLIDRQMNMIPQLYEICCKLFESDVQKLRAEWDSAIG